MRPSTIHVVVGGQYGSEAKGHVAAHLSKQRIGDNVIGIRVGGPNAGHTVVGRDGDRWALRQIPVAAVTNRHARLVIAAGSEIDTEVLEREITDLDGAGYSVSNRLFIDREVTLIDPAHKIQEAELSTRIGSTAKGIGAARAARLMRTAATYAHRGEGSDTAPLIRDWMVAGARVVIEGTQGYGLGLHAGNYPYVTAGNCRVIDCLAQTGIGPWDGLIIPVVVVRPNPIRVAGNSGPMIGETTWEDLGLNQERTTVTQKIRRVGAWDHNLVAAAIAANGGAEAQIALSMFDHVSKNDVDQDDPARLNQAILKDWRNKIARAGGRLRFVTTGPATCIDLSGTPQMRDRAVNRIRL